MKSWQYRRLNRGDHVYVTTGKLKEKTLKVSYISDSKIYGTVVGMNPNEEVVSTNYTNAEMMDAHGKPVIYPVVDATGREIAIDSWIVYSCAAGRNSHALEIGKVLSLGKTGTVKVKPMVHDGRPVRERSWGPNERTVNDTDRSLVLPVDVPTMTSWILKDFQDLKDRDS